MKIINLTPHAVNIYSSEGEKMLTIEASGTVARVSCKTVTVDTINGIPVTANEYGAIEGLPEPVDGTIYVVSSLVAGRCKNRDDVFIPNEPVRDDAGRVIGCKSLGRV